MPLYEYECRSCDTRFDELTTLAAADDAVCARCGSTEVKRLLSVIGGMTGSAGEPVGCGGCAGGCACAN